MGLDHNLGHTPYTWPEYDYAEDFASRVRDLNAELFETNFTSVFSWACYNHCVATEESGFLRLTCEPEATTMSHALVQFMQGERRIWQDTCATFGCGRGCSSSDFMTD